MYVAAFVVAVRTDRKADYLRMAEEAGAVFRDHGALRVVECWGDEVPDGKVTSFPMAVKLEPGETVVFSWIEYPDKQTAVTGMEAAMKDPRLADAGPPEGIMAGQRMIYGNFTPILDM